MQLRIVFCLILTLFSKGVDAQQKENNLLYQLESAIKNNNESVAAQVWDSIAQGKQPYIWGDSVAFIYHGKANSVSWNGDFNGWGSDTRFDNKGSRIGNSNFWELKTSFPADARFDYKIVVDGHWILDPANEAIQMAGIGGLSPNSELRMPESKPSQWTEDTARSKGQLTNWTTLPSESLGYDVNYKVYFPDNYSKINALPTIYCTDGNEYTHPQLGAMVEILDNLIEQKKIEPVIVVFIDPRDPSNPQHNRRMDEYNLNEKFLSFVTQELVPQIDSTYKTAKDRAHRTIMGTSMGGLNASFIAAKAPELFANLLIQSPAYRYRPAIYKSVNNSKVWPLKVSISTGVFNDTQAAALKMKEIYLTHLDSLQYIEVNEGHSWGSWRNTLDDQLIYLLSN
ncbi:alpha/beta hydrolase-fold protein [Fulvivirga lutea]|uniref:Esterase family protein n=1 Tax=Fulvivirga lutea TaxID=2810512 RepID=A0A974WFM8_9BACT|nr:alpha/beta hydrolase-fold protein [Fulvivirga lutea]QSE96232.1 hypothetical protein JR347_11480 [Fulvivirga lutea]